MGKPVFQLNESENMKIVVCPSDQAGCGKYRMFWPAEALQARGKPISIEKRPRILTNQTINPPEVIDALVDTDTKVMVFQRPASYQISQLIPLLHHKGIKVVIDLDDDLSCIHPKNYAYSVYDPQLSPHRNWEYVKKACEMADVITATTEALLEKYAIKAQGFLIPNCIPERFLKIESTPNELVTVGWAGWVRTHPDDLQTTHGAINEAIVKQNARFMAIGDPDIFNKLQVRRRFPNEFHPSVDFDDYPDAIAKLDIGIVPLADTPFNKSKSWLKALEYAAVGVAPVVAPTPDNMRLVEQGGAYVARSPKAWKEAVRSLIVNEEERFDLVKRARNIAAEWTVEANSWRWEAAWCTL